MYDKVAICVRVCVCAAIHSVPRQMGVYGVVWYENEMSEFNYRGNDLTKMKTVENMVYEWAKL